MHKRHISEKAKALVDEVVKAILESAYAERGKCNCATCRMFCLVVSEAFKSLGEDAESLVVSPYIVLARRLAEEQHFLTTIIAEGAALIETAEQQTAATKP